MTLDRTLYVSLFGWIDVDAWHRNYGRGTVEDLEPYGLHRLRDHGWETVYRPALPKPHGSRPGMFQRVAEGLNLDGYLADHARRRRSHAVLCWTEQDGILVAGGRVWKEPPCVTGVIWVTDHPTSLTHAAARLALPRAAGIFTFTRPQREALIEQFKLDPDRVRYIPFGIAVDRWVLPAERVLTRPLVVTAGNDRDRQPEVCLEAVRLAQHEVPDLRLEVLSDREMSLPPEIGVQRRASGFDDMRATYARASVVVVTTRPNLHGSGMTVALEAMACGVPVVATATAGMEDYIEDGVTGLLAPPGQPEEVAERVARLVQDTSLARDIGLAGRDSVRCRHTSARMVSDLASLINRVAD